MKKTKTLISTSILSMD